LVNLAFGLLSEEMKNENSFILKLIDINIKLTIISLQIQPT
jgi:hypothetical protein